MFLKSAPMEDMANKNIKALILRSLRAHTDDVITGSDVISDEFIGEGVS